MTVRHAYLALCAAGTTLPYLFFVPFLREHGLDGPRFVRQLFSTPIGGFFGTDVLVSTLVLWTLVLTEGRRARVPHLWAPLAASLAVGVSLGLPLYLYLRERKHVGRGRVPTPLDPISGSP